MHASSSANNQRVSRQSYLGYSGLAVQPPVIAEPPRTIRQRDRHLMRHASCCCTPARANTARVLIVRVAASAVTPLSIREVNSRWRLSTAAHKSAPITLPLQRIFKAIRKDTLAAAQSTFAPPGMHLALQAECLHALTACSGLVVHTLHLGIPHALHLARAPGRR